MLQVAFISKNIELVKQRLAIKYFADSIIVDKIIELDDERLKNYKMKLKKPKCK